MVDADYLQRYARHIMLKEIGGPGQTKLRDADVTLVGAGGLGCPAALYLAAAGVGRITLIDDDVVSLSNLQRQILYSSDDVGRPKVEVAKERLIAINPELEVNCVGARVGVDHLPSSGSNPSLILDGSDNFETRHAVNAHCHRARHVLVSGAVGRWDGQVAVFRSGLEAGGPCYQCFVPEAPDVEEDCATVGVMGPLTGIVGTRMALEAIKEITGAGTSLAGRLWLFDGLSGDTRTVKLAQDPACEVLSSHIKEVNVTLS